MNTKDVWDKYHLDIQQFLRSKIKDELVVDDLLQDTFIKVHTKLEALRDESKLKSWVFSIARNTLFSYFKHNKLNIDVEDYMIQVEVQEPLHTEKDCLHGIIKSLPKKYREPIFLSDIKGLKQAEIATQLNLALPTAKSRIQRARKLIAKGFMDCCDYKLNPKGYLVGEVKDKEFCKVCN